jgi:hypothetical protein
MDQPGEGFPPPLPLVGEMQQSVSVYSPAPRLSTVYGKSISSRSTRTVPLQVSHSVSYGSSAQESPNNV